MNYTVIFERQTHFSSEKPSEKTRVKPSVKTRVKIENTTPKTREITDNTRVKPSVKTRVKPSEKTSEKILKIIKDNPRIKTNDLAEITGKTKRTIEMQLRKLKEKNKIERVGPDKGGYWKVIELK